MPCLLIHSINSHQDFALCQASELIAGNEGIAKHLYQRSLQSSRETDTVTKSVSMKTANKSLCWTLFGHFPWPPGPVCQRQHFHYFWNAHLAWLSSFPPISQSALSCSTCRLLFLFFLFKKFLYCFKLLIPLQMSPISPHICPPPPSSCPPPWPSPPVVCVHRLCMYVYVFFGKSQFHPCFHHTPLGDLSVCSTCPHLWSSFVCQFILFTRFHIAVRSYGICLSLTGLFHLA